MQSTIVYAGCISVLIFVAVFVFSYWDHWWWIKLGRPQFTAGEQLRIDVLRAQGRTLTSARRSIVEQRNSPFMAEIQSIRDTAELINNPDREEDLRDLLRR